MSQEAIKSEKVSSGPSSISFTLGRRAMKFIDVKGTLADKYLSDGFDVKWQQDNFSEVSTFNDKLVISISESNIATISFGTFTYSSSLKESELDTLNFNMFQLLEDIDRDFLNVKQYDFLLFNAVFPVASELVPFILAGILKLRPAQITELVSSFIPDGILLRFNGIPGKQDFEYYLSISNFVPTNVSNQVQPSDKVSIEFNLRQEGTWKLEDILNVLENAIANALSLTQNFVNEALTWQPQ